MKPPAAHRQEGQVGGGLFHLEPPIAVANEPFGDVRRPTMLRLGEDRPRPGFAQRLDIGGWLGADLAFAAPRRKAGQRVEKLFGALAGHAGLQSVTTMGRRSSSTCLVQSPFPSAPSESRCCIQSAGSPPDPGSGRVRALNAARTVAPEGSMEEDRSASLSSPESRSSGGRSGAPRPHGRHNGEPCDRQAAVAKEGGRLAVAGRQHHKLRALRACGALEAPEQLAAERSPQGLKSFIRALDHDDCLDQTPARHRQRRGGHVLQSRLQQQQVGRNRGGKRLAHPRRSRRGLRARGPRCPNAQFSARATRRPRPRPLLERPVGSRRERGPRTRRARPSAPGSRQKPRDRAGAGRGARSEASCAPAPNRQLADAAQEA